jgi:hypothetical protein
MSLNLQMFSANNPMRKNSRELARLMNFTKAYNSDARDFGASDGKTG